MLHASLLRSSCNLRHAVPCAHRADLTAKRRERVRADARAQELRSDLRRGLSRLAGPLPEEVLSALNANKEEQAFQSALIHLQSVRAMCTGRTQY
jgi:hypothetical protein